MYSESPDFQFWGLADPPNNTHLRGAHLAKTNQQNQIPHPNQLLYEFSISGSLPTCTNYPGAAKMSRRSPSGQQPMAVSQLACFLLPIARGGSRMAE